MARMVFGVEAMGVPEHQSGKRSRSIQFQVPEVAKAENGGVGRTIGPWVNPCRWAIASGVFLFPQNTTRLDARGCRVATSVSEWTNTRNRVPKSPRSRS